MTLAGGQEDDDARVGLHAPAARGELARHLNLTVVRGRRPRDASGSCAQFTPDARDFGLGPFGTIFRGRLDEFPAGGAARVVDPGVWAPGDSIGYRFALTLGDDPAAEGLRAAWDWRFAVEPVASGRAEPSAAAEAPRLGGPQPGPVAAPGSPARCATLRLRRGKRLIKTRRWSRTHRVVLTATPGAAGLRVTARLRTRRGRYVRDPRWQQVAWSVGGDALVTDYRRPFAMTIPARRLRPGANAFVVGVRPRVGKPRRARFVISATPAAAGTRCTLR